MTDDKNPYSEFAADCYYLWQAGAVYLPLIADVYGRAAGLLAGGDQGGGTLGDAFVRMGSTIQKDNVEIQGPIQPSYVAFRDDVASVFARISDRLYRVGEALEQSAWLFAEQDVENINPIGTATDQLEGLISDREQMIIEDKESNSPDILPEAPDKDDLSDPNFHKNDEHLVPEEGYPTNDPV